MRSWASEAACVAAAALAVSAAVLNSPPASRAPASAGAVFVLTGNEKGFIRPCGCSKPAHGGVHRRAEVLDELRKTDPALIPVSGGDFIVESGRQQQLKLETALLALGAMGYVAFAPGPGEFLLGADTLLQAREIAGFPFVCANVKRDGQLLFDRTCRLGDTPWLLTGLVPGLPGVAGLEASPPAEALAEVVAGLAERDHLLVIWNGKDDDVRKIAAAVPADCRPRVVVAFGGSSDLPRALDPVDGVRIVAIGSKGRDVCIVRPDPGEQAFVAHRRLEEALKGREDIRAMLDGYRQALKDERLAENWPRREAASTYIGDSGCIECHKEICAQLDPTPHEHAFASLEATNDHYDPECVSCHVVGWAEQGGYVSPEQSKHLVNVQCEACHGPGEAHAQSQAKTPNGKLGSQYCLRCHDADNSPQFKFDLYWPKIQHK